MTIQSVILPKSKFTEAQAVKWIKDHNFSLKGQRIKNYKSTNFYRFRQQPPSHFKSYTMRKLLGGVRLVIGVR